MTAKRRSRVCSLSVGTAPRAGGVYTNDFNLPVMSMIQLQTDPPPPGACDPTVLRLLRIGLANRRGGSEAMRWDVCV